MPAHSTATRSSPRSARALARSPSRSTTATRAPRWSRARTVASPSPEAPPVTSAAASRRRSPGSLGVGGCAVSLIALLWTARRSARSGGRRGRDGLRTAAAYADRRWRETGQGRGPPAVESVGDGEQGGRRAGRRRAGCPTGAVRARAAAPRAARGRDRGHPPRGADRVHGRDRRPGRHDQADRLPVLRRPRRPLPGGRRALLRRPHQPLPERRRHQRRPAGQRGHGDRRLPRLRRGRPPGPPVPAAPAAHRPAGGDLRVPRRRVHRPPAPPAAGGGGAGHRPRRALGPHGRGHGAGGQHVVAGPPRGAPRHPGRAPEHAAVGRTGADDRVSRTAGPGLAGAARAAAEAAGAAEVAARRAGVEVADLREMGELGEAADLFVEVWQTSTAEAPCSPPLLRALAYSGNYVAGARRRGRMVGASVGFLHPEGGTVALHSHITGVAARAQGRSVGFALKQHQRAWALARGFGLVTWTFDPLVRRNAFFNLVKLGAEIVEYLPGFYGRMEDAINAGDETDRCLVVWPLERERAVAASHDDVVEPDLEGLRAAGALALLAEDADGRPAVAGRGDLGTSGTFAAGTLLVQVPRDIVAVRAADPALAVAWRRALRATLAEALAHGFAVTGITRSGWYVLERTREELR